VFRALRGIDLHSMKSFSIGPLLRTVAAATAVILIGAAAAAGEVRVFYGTAVNEDGELEYTEQHALKLDDGRIVESETTYFDPSYREIGSLVSEYSRGQQFGSYDFVDLRAGYRDGVRVLEDRILLYHSEGAAETPKTRYLPREAGQVVGQGFNYFIAENIGILAGGGTLKIKLILPSRLDQFDFRIRKRMIEGDTLFVRLEIDNPILRLFAPHIDAAYDMQTGRLMRYEGISNLTDGAGEYRHVTINYEYR
jgi:hypothetical protein